VAYTPHDVIKPEKIAATAAVALEESLVVPAVFQREGIDQFKGAKNDAINVKVEGVLPFRTYGWRNDRSTEIQFDTYAEKTVQVTFGGDIYSAVQLTDEQNEFDLQGWAKLMAKQTEAVGAVWSTRPSTTCSTPPTRSPSAVRSPAATCRKTLIRAREVLNKFRVPKEGRTLLVGTDWENELLSDEDLNLAVQRRRRRGRLRSARGHHRPALRLQHRRLRRAAPTSPCRDGRSPRSSSRPAPRASRSPSLRCLRLLQRRGLRWIRDYDATRLVDRSWSTPTRASAPSRTSWSAATPPRPGVRLRVRALRARDQARPRRDRGRPARPGRPGRQAAGARRDHRHRRER
jgi:hypothetical protein